MQKLQENFTPAANVIQKAESDLDSKMREILNQTTLTVDEKIKMYNQLLQRFLKFQQMRNTEDKEITFKIPQEMENIHQPTSQDISLNKGEDDDEIMKEILQSINPRFHKNSKLILKKLLKNSDGWSTQGEFMFKGKIIRGSHMLDLIKHISTNRKSPKYTPVGWKEFLITLAKINVPLSTMLNTKAREQIKFLKMHKGAFRPPVQALEAGGYYNEDDADDDDGKGEGDSEGDENEGEYSMPWEEFS